MNAKTSASKKDAKNPGKAVQLDFLPARPAYPAELEGAAEPLIRLGDEVWIRRDRIVNQPDPALNRYTTQEWQAQLDSMRRLGQKSAVHVRAVPNGYWLEDGRHRFLAVGELGWDYVKADIDHKGNAASSAVWRLEANARRKADRPLDVALGWQELMRGPDADPPGPGLNQKQVAELAGVSQASVSRRMRLVHPSMNRDLAMQIGQGIEEHDLEPLFQVLDDAALATAGAEAVLKALRKQERRPTAHGVLELMAQAWHDAELAIPIDAECFTYDVTQDPAWRKAVKGFQPFTVKLPSSYDARRMDEATFFRRAKEAVAKAQEISDRLQVEADEAERQAAEKEAKAAAKAGKAEPEGPKRRSIEERLPERTRRIQLESMARHLRAQVSFPEDLVVEALARYVDKCGALHAKADQATALAALGVAPESKQAEEMMGHGLSIQGYYRDLAPKGTRHGLDWSRPEDGFHALWAKDRTAALRCVATAMFFDHNQGASNVLDDEGAFPGVKLLTGISHEDAEALARQSLKDQDAGFKPVLDGAPCDHCDEPARLRKGGVNVCRSDVHAGIDTKSLATRRLARVHARQPETGAPAEAPPSPA